MNPLVSPQWVSQHSSDDLVILDASIEFQIPNESPKDTVNKIPSSRRFDYDASFCDPDSSLPHMMPNESRFNVLAQALGINQNSIVVIYDNSGTFASPRAWWMFRAMGHQQVFIIDGGLPSWKDAELPVSTEYNSMVNKGNFSGKLNPDYFINADKVLGQINNPQSLTLDARSRARFLSQVPEPREGIRSGHIPNSMCLPFAELMNNTRLKPLNDLKAIFSDIEKQGVEQMIFSCGSGVTACIVLLAAYLCGLKKLSVYDGSWTEWGQRVELPINTNANA